MPEMNDETARQPEHRIEQERELSEAILALLAAAPQAVSLTSIIEWWLTQCPVQVAIEAVARTVQRLVKQEILEEVGQEQPHLYRLKRRNDSLTAPASPSCDAP